MKETELPLYLQARNYLLGLIKEMKVGENRLEPEHTVAARLGMSRETIRKAMSALIEEGCITRRHGNGNFGLPAVANLAMRVDKNSDFKRLLASAGYAVRSFRSSMRRAAPSAGMLRRMPEAEGSEVVIFDVDFTADGRSAIFGTVELPQDLVIKEAPAGEYSGNLKGFFKDYCRSESNHTTAWLIAEHNDGICSRFGLAANTPILCWEEVYYDLAESRLGYVKIWFNPSIMDLSLLLSF